MNEAEYSSKKHFHIFSWKNKDVLGTLRQLKLLRCVSYVSWDALSCIDDVLVEELTKLGSISIQPNNPNVVTGDPFFPPPVVCRLLLLPPETYSFSQFSRRFFVPCLERGALRRCSPFQKCIQRQSLTNPKFTFSRNPVEVPLPSLSLLKYNAFH